jgi:SAM-dependent methyltransferase
MGLWAKYVLPHLVELACRGSAVAEERERLVPRAHGRVLEIGVGSGLNLRYYDARRAERVVAFDPSPELVAMARPRAVLAPVPIELAVAAAEALPFADASFDSAVVTYTLCSVEEPQRALAEVKRVLKPGGELYFVEHGLSDEVRTQRWQHRLTPAWSFVGGGCHLDRDVAAELRAAGFALDELRAEHGEGAKWLSFTYEGVARAPA